MFKLQTPCQFMSHSMQHHSPPLCLSAARCLFFLSTTHKVKQAINPSSSFSSTTSVPPVTNPPHHFCAYFPTSTFLSCSPELKTLYKVMFVLCHTLSISQKKG